MKWIALALAACSPPAIDLPDGAPGIGFDDLRYSARLHRVLVPAGRSGRVDLIDPDTLAVTPLGAFSQEANAKALQKKLSSIGHEATIEHTSLYLVRIGPFETRDQAASVRAKLEAAGISAIITTQ